MKWRPTLFVLHRDVGFFCLGLTLVYAISGVAVNHREHWDYNHSIEQRVAVIGEPAVLLGVATQEPPGEVARQHQAGLVTAIGEHLGRDTAPRKVFWSAPNRLSLFYGIDDEDVVDYLPERGAVEHQAKDPRWLIRQTNFLHLNEGRSLWTYVADAFAVLLVFLATSGVIMTRGRRGLRGRGGVLAALGILLPILSYLLLT